jgi:hypothetical protein
MFAIQLGIGREQMEAMSVPDMVDHTDYWFELNRGSQDGH